MEFLDQELPKYPVYHPNSELRERPGFYPNISKSQSECIKDLQRKIDEAGINFDDGKEIYLMKLLRFLRARDFNVQKSFDMVQADYNWRNTDNRMNLANETARDVIQCDPCQFYKFFPAWMSGYDKQFRPIAWRQFGKFEIWNILKITTMDRLIRFHGWEAEQATRLLYEKSKITGYNIETFTLIVDAAGISYYKNN